MKYRNKIENYEKVKNNLFISCHFLIWFYENMMHFYYLKNHQIQFLMLENQIEKFF